MTDGLAKVPGVVSLRGLYPEHVERALIRVKADLESRQPKGANLRRRGESDADGKAARPKEATPDKRGVNDRHKTPKACQVSAMKAYKYALKQSEPKPPSSGAVMPETPESLQLKTDTDVYDWLKDEQETKGLPNGYKLPSFHTWARYLRVVRRQTRTKKNTPAAGRAGRSVVSARALDKRGDGKKS